jgi:hypothetical protein
MLLDDPFVSAGISLVDSTPFSSITGSIPHVGILRLRLPGCSLRPNIEDVLLDTAEAGPTPDSLSRSSRMTPRPQHLPYCGVVQDASQMTKQQVYYKGHRYDATVWGISRKWIYLDLPL